MSETPELPSATRLCCVAVAASVVLGCGGSPGSQESADGGSTSGAGGSWTTTDAPAPATSEATTGTTSSTGTTDGMPTPTAGSTGDDASTGSPPPSDGSTGSSTTAADDPSDGSSSSGDGGASEGTSGGEMTDELCSLSDDFESSATAAQWSLLDVFGMGPQPQWDISVTLPGALTVTPTASGWYEDFRGFLLWQSVEGDFAVETSVAAASVSDSNASPALPYNSAGLLVRDPAGSVGSEAWLAFNVGMQDGQIGTEKKITMGSNSQLTIDPGAATGVLRICRSGSTLIVARQLEGEAALQEVGVFNYAFPETVQVGLMANGWNSFGATPDTSVSPDVVGTFDYVRYWSIDGAEDCLLPPPPCAAP